MLGKKDKKGQMSGAIWGIVGVGVAFVVVTLVLAFGSDILDDTQGDMTANSYSYNTTGKGLESLNKFGTKLPLIAGVVVAVIIIGLLIAGFMGYMKR